MDNTTPGSCPHTASFDPNHWVNVALAGHSPRVIDQDACVYLVSRYGELWRVYDTSLPRNTTLRVTPTSNSELPHRVFVALARTPELRVHTFTPAGGRTVDPGSLQDQLDQSSAA